MAKTKPPAATLLFRNANSTSPYRVVIRKPDKRPKSGSGRIVKGEIMETMDFQPNVPRGVSTKQLEACGEAIGKGILRHTEPAADEEQDPRSDTSGTAPTPEGSETQSGDAGGDGAA